ncbi:PREDICTED: uncharacterized protein At1g15400 [Ipomoea nil]|uniref:uncharacterized protein At1g15400 n=1 Tax=Ipomoea nil TaxID=35883 RepID=UPI000901CAD1|nr:PREDICTED: uncharacterized protein At1g15400 [Ipomoea nil]
MAALPRSEVSFRRQGSSGLVWDDKLLSGELKKISTKDEGGDQTKEAAKPSSVQRSRSSGGGRGFRSTEIKPSYDPPSPKVSGCGICGMFGKPVDSKQQPSRKAAAHRPHRR